MVENHFDIVSAEDFFRYLAPEHENGLQCHEFIKKKPEPQIAKNGDLDIANAVA